MFIDAPNAKAPSVDPAPALTSRQMEGAPESGYGAIINAAMLEVLRRAIKEPIPAIFRAWDMLSSAVEAHRRGNHTAAEVLFRQADSPELWNWVNPCWAQPHLNVRLWKPEGDTFEVPKIQRDLLRDPPRELKAIVLARDGYRCRYCGIPVVDAKIRKIAHTLYPNAVPWISRDPRQQHAAFQCFWLQYDHVMPHSHGGLSSEDNVVVSCALCNFGKDKYTLRQLGLSDPRLRQPEHTAWDGLESLRVCGSTKLISSV